MQKNKIEIRKEDGASSSLSPKATNGRQLKLGEYKDSIKSIAGPQRQGTLC